jgi:hypothetical protein
MLYHLRIYSRTHSISVMTTGRTELLEHGQRRRIRKGCRTFQELRARWSSSRTKHEYTAACDHTIFQELADVSV